MFLFQFVHKLEEIASPELELKYQATTELFAALGEHVSGAEVDYVSYKLHAHEADCTALRCLDEDVRTCVEHLSPPLSAPQHALAVEALQQRLAESSALWEKWQALISLLTDLTVCAYYCLPFYFYLKKEVIFTFCSDSD